MVFPGATCGSNCLSNAPHSEFDGFTLILTCSPLLSVSCKVLIGSRSLIKSRLLFLLLFFFPCQTAAKVVVWTYFSYSTSRARDVSLSRFQRCWVWSLYFHDISLFPQYEVFLLPFQTPSLQPWSSPLLGVTKWWYCNFIMPSSLGENFKEKFSR